jgi:predicted RNase H-like HicB family nuclease
MSTASPFTAVIRQDGPWWIGWVEEVPGVNAQEQGREALLQSLSEILREALELSRQDAIEAARPRCRGACVDPVKRRHMLHYLSSCACEQLWEGGNLS